MRPTKRTFLGVLVLVLAGAGCAAQKTAQKATEGAVEGLEGEVPAPSADTQALPASVGGNLVKGVLEQLTKPEQIEQLRQVVAAAAAGGMRGLAGGGGGAGGGGEARSRAVASGMGGSGAVPVEGPVGVLAAQAARAFSAAFAQEMVRQLGTEGEGALANSLAATTARMSSSAAQGIGGSLGDLFPECEGPDRRACLDARVAALGKEASRGFTEGVREALGPLPLLLAFLLGFLVALIALWGVSVWRRAGAAARTPA